MFDSHKRFRATAESSQVESNRIGLDWIGGQLNEWVYWIELNWILHGLTKTILSFYCDVVRHNFFISLALSTPRPKQFEPWHTPGIYRWMDNNKLTKKFTTFNQNQIFRFLFVLMHWTWLREIVKYENTYERLLNYKKKTHKCEDEAIFARKESERLSLNITLVYDQASHRDGYLALRIQFCLNMTKEHELVMLVICFESEFHAKDPNSPTTSVEIRSRSVPQHPYL